MRYAQIVSTGRYIPEKTITNDDLNVMLGENVGDWLVAKVGIRERHVMAENETTSDMIVAASRQAMQRAGIVPADLDLIIVATDTPDYLSPATASAVLVALEFWPMIAHAQAAATAADRAAQQHVAGPGRVVFGLRGLLVMDQRDIEAEGAQQFGHRDIAGHLSARVGSLVFACTLPP